MTREHFEALARALAATRPPMGDGGSCDRYGYEVWYAAYDAIADVCTAFNDRFDRTQFAWIASQDSH